MADITQQVKLIFTTIQEVLLLKHKVIWNTEKELDTLKKLIKKI